MKLKYGVNTNTNKRIMIHMEIKQIKYKRIKLWLASLNTKKREGILINTIVINTVICSRYMLQSRNTLDVKALLNPRSAIK